MRDEKRGLRSFRVEGFICGYQPLESRTILSHWVEVDPHLANLADHFHVAQMF